MTPTPSQDPPIPQGGGGLMLWPWPWQGGWGGDPEPGTYIPVWPSFFQKKIRPPVLLSLFLMLIPIYLPKVRPEITCCSIEGLLHPSKTYVSKLLASHRCFCLFKVGIFGSFQVCYASQDWWCLTHEVWKSFVCQWLTWGTKEEVGSSSPRIWSKYSV